jgi:hypothetical protein
MMDGARTLLAPSTATQDPALSPDIELERYSFMYVCIIMAATKPPTVLSLLSVPPHGKQEICRSCLSGIDHRWFLKTDVAKYGMSYKAVIDGGVAYQPFNAVIKSPRAALPDEIFYWGFCFLNLHFFNICVKTQQIHQLFIQFINYVWNYHT